MSQKTGRFALGTRSQANLAGVHPHLRAVVERAIQLTRQDFTVVEGVRSKERMWEIFGQGRTRAECRAAGVPESYARPGENRVTWLRNPLNSNHRRMPDGFGHAVDIYPFPYDHKDLRKFDEIALAMMSAAVELGIRIRWGADWDMDGKPRERGESDSPHFEIAA